MSLEAVPELSSAKKQSLLEEVLSTIRERKTEKKREEDKKRALEILPILHFAFPQQVETQGDRTRGKLDIASLVSLDEIDRKFLLGEDADNDDREIFVSSFGQDDSGRLMFRCEDRHLVYEVNGRGLVVYWAELIDGSWGGSSEVRESYKSFFEATNTAELAVDSNRLKALHLVSSADSP